MTNTDQSFIARAKQEIFELQRRRAIKLRREKIEDQQLSSELELFLDTLAAEGVDVNTVAGLAIAFRAWCRKKGIPLNADYELPRDWDTTEGPFCD